MSTAAPTSDGMAQLVASRDAMARVLAMAGHDLRQPLQLAMLALQRIAEGGLTPRSDEWLRTAGDALSRLNNELGDIARMSQHEASVLPFVQPVMLDEIMHEVERDWRRYGEICGIRLIIDHRSAVVSTDRAMLRSILRNLVGNAIRYSSKGDKVTVDCTVTGDRVSIGVHDEGRGISTAQIDRIFDAFVRGVRDDGLGLGLTIVRQMAEELGIPITVQSIEGVGSTFNVELPLVAKHASANDNANTRPTGEPIATIRLPVRVPFGFHGVGRQTKLPSPQANRSIRRTT